MTTMTPGPVPVTDRSEAAPPTPGEPIFAALAARWAEAGRVVPGQADGEWAMLAGNCPWPRR
ncbi:hypothetical protein ABZS88_45525 [Streptomyces sp. NPDC005480]|uniref:hypothetical protein n=1 Tax=Streptomyces sp. NPDC005480 TaxID=3154880 RepID=UPI0033B14327